MKFKSILLQLCGALMCAAIMSGCSKTGASSSVQDPAKIAVAVNQAFAKAPEPAKEAATTYVAAVQSEDGPAAFAQLQRMRAAGDLTPQQREVIAKAMQSTVKQLQSAAQSGNPKAQTVLHQYLSTR